jgi:hypothetical protein
LLTQQSETSLTRVKDWALAMRFAISKLKVEK